MLHANQLRIAQFGKKIDFLESILKKFIVIIFLQETYSAKEIEKYWTQQWKGKIVFSHGTYHSKGVAVLFKTNTEYVIKNCNADSDGRVIVLEMEVQGYEFIIINVYFPCANKLKEQEALWDKVRNMVSDIENYDDKYIVMGGDFKVITNLALDRDGGNPSYNENVKRKINNFKNDFYLVDIWRVGNQNLRQYTWRQKSPLFRVD